MSLTSADGYGGRVPAGTVALGAAPRLSGAVDFSTWATLFLNWLQRNRLQRAVERETKGLKALMEVMQQWEDEAEEESIRAALGSSNSSSYSFSASPRKQTSSSVKEEDVEAAASRKKTELENRRAVAQLVSRSTRVYGVLYECLPEELRAQVPTLSGDAFALWRWLENKFQSKEADNVGTLLEQWSAMRMEEDESFDAYRARVMKLHSLLAAAKETISPAQFSLILLGRLQPRFRQVVLALQASGTTKDASKIDWDDVASMINAHERSEQRMNGTGEEEKMMMAAAAYGRQKHNRQQHHPSSTSSSSFTSYPPGGPREDDIDGPLPHHRMMVCHRC